MDDEEKKKQEALRSLEGEEAKQAIKDIDNMSFSDFSEKYKTEYCKATIKSVEFLKSKLIVEKFDLSKFKCSQCDEHGCSDGDIHDAALKTKIKEIIQTWVRSLKSGSGDYKIMYVNDWMKLLIKLGLANEADKELLKDLTM